MHHKSGFEKLEPWIKLGCLSKSCIQNVILYFIQMLWYITHYLFFFPPYFRQGIWSSNSLGESWQGRKARIYGSADGTCTVTFTSSGIFSSGKSICKTHEYTYSMSLGWQHVDSCYTVVTRQRAVNAPAVLGSC